VIHVVGSGQTETLIALPETLRLQAGNRLRREVQAVLGPYSMDTAAGTMANGGPKNDCEGCFRVHRQGFAKK
jgi:hypothetical protein